MDFPVRHELLNNKFNAYRLSNGDTKQETHTLPSYVAVHTGGAALGLVEVKERSLHNALEPAKVIDSSDAAPVAAYIDVDGKLVTVTLGDKPAFATVAALQTKGPITPSLASIDADTWVASTGGVPELIKLENGTAAWSSAIDIPLEATDTPWTVIRADKHESNALVLVQRARRQDKDVKFDVALLRLSISKSPTTALLWHVVGAQPVVYAHPGKTYTLGAEAPFTKDDESVLPPFAWTQTPNGVNVSFTVSSSVEQKAIHVEFTPECAFVRLDPAPTFTEAGDDDEKHMAAENRIRAGDYIGRHFWDAIDAKDSTWSYERVSADKHAAVRLALHLVKKHHGEHWNAVFKDGEQVAETSDEAPSAPASDAPPDASLDKYTSEEPSEHSTAGVGMQTNLLQDGLEEEDALEGTPLVITTISGDLVSNPRGAQSTIIARAAPTKGTGNYFLAKRDTDGLLYRQKDGWEHSETLPGIAYVLASKRDAHPVYVHGEHEPPVVLAIEAVRHDSASRATSAGNLYTYSVAAGQDSGTSHVLRIGGIDADANGGIGTVQGAAVLGSVLAVLCERALVLISGIF
ncbi:hypothetical protein MCUN1_000392 [Malassezia cuniculi]|uniref:NudC domain-containing protein 1 n=1 Tax=Malassezia cuniculi TaxID=948313 RepID=A0AAF0ERF8_9BASI|nr:hypothetical protein MCUN1_000392 [Malassezia cuniculi]